MRYVAEGTCVLAALVFGFSAGSKLGSAAAYRRFRAALASTGLLPGRPRPLRSVLTAGLAAAESVVALSLAFAAILAVIGSGPWVVVSLLALILACALAGLLIAGVAVLVRRGVLARCACFGGTASEPIGVVHLARNLTLLAVLLAGLLAVGLAGAGRGGPEPAAGVVMAVVAGGCGALLIARWEDLAVLVTPVSSIRASRRTRAGAS